MNLLGQFFGTPTLLGLAALEAMMLTLFTMALAKPASRSDTLNWLRAPRGTKFYDRTVGGLLRRIDRTLDNPEIANDNYTAWSGSLLDFALRLAIAYPTLTLAFYWGWTGNEAGFGRNVVFPGLPGSFVHLVYLVGLFAIAVLLGFALYQQRNQNDRLRGRFVFAAFAVAFAVAQAYALNFAFVLTDPILGPLGGAVSLAVAFALAFSFAGAVAGAVALTGALAVAVAFALAFLLIGALTGAVALEVVYIRTDAFEPAFAVAFTGSLAVVVALAVAVAVAFERHLTRARAPIISYLFYLIFWLGLAAIALNLVDEVFQLPDLVIQVPDLALFLVILPIINGLYDWLSFGTTLHLIKKGVSARGVSTIFWGLADLIAAVVLFAALGCTLVLTITFFNFVSLTPLIDLGGTLSDIADNPHRYWWLYVGTFSTILPTLIHFGLTGLCFVSWFPQWLRSWIADNIESENGYANFFGRAALSLLGTVLVVLALLPVAALAWTLYQFYPDIGRVYLWMITQLANLFGAGVQKSDIFDCVGCA